MSDEHRPPELPEHDEADLAEFADGRLDPRRAEALRRRAEAHPELAAALERDRQGLALVQAAASTTRAPQELRHRLEAMQQAAPAPGRVGRRPRRPRPRWRLVGWAAAPAAVAVVAAILVLGGGPGLQPDDALALGTRPATARVRARPDDPKVLRTAVEGVAFPDWTRDLSWRPQGARSDRLDGRTVRTVFYAKGSKRVAYSIVGGAALDPGDGRVVRRGSVEFHQFGTRGRRAVTWRRGGHTCVLSGRGVSDDVLLNLAGWNAA